MSSFIKRISGRLKMTGKSFRSDLHFSFRYAFLRVGSELGGRLHLRRLSRKATDKKNRWIEAYLEKQLQAVLKEYEDDSDIGLYVPDAPIWVCWWTGEDTAPPLVQRCIQSIRLNANGHPVHLITRENYREYLDIPDYILNKVNDGIMCVANFTDYLRFSLLAKYGGLWLDATIYCSQKLPEDIFRLPLFTCKGRTADADYYSNYRWTSFCFGGYRGNVALRFLQAAFDAYWKQNPVSIDYLLVDYIISLAYRKNPAVHRLMNELPENNLHRDDLQAAMNNARPAREMNHIIRPETVLYKLSWRETYSKVAQDGGSSVFDYFLSENFLGIGP